MRRPAGRLRWISRLGKPLDGDDGAVGLFGAFVFEPQVGGVQHAVAQHEAGVVVQWSVALAGNDEALRAVERARSICADESLGPIEGLTFSVGICDSVEANTKFAKNLELDYPILSDPGKKVAKAYGVVTTVRLFPHRWTFYIGKDGKILYIDKKVKTKSHGADVAKKLAELKVAVKEQQPEKKKKDDESES